MGLAPIGHVVTVDTAIGVNVNVSTSVTCSSGYTFDGLKSIIIAAIESYFSISPDCSGKCRLCNSKNIPNREQDFKCYRNSRHY